MRTRPTTAALYYRINQFPDYGKLAHLDLEQLRPSGRVSSDEYEKESVGDFALWKAWDEADGDVGWDSPWGRGRPGWHIECSAMAGALLGDQIDIHCGGVDNIFPHHEAEIAQTEALTGKKFVRTWMHCAHLMVDGQKMSKSLGNFYTLRDVLAKGYAGREIRYALLRVNYGLPLNFTFDGMNDAREALRRIDAWVARLQDHAASADRERAALELADHERFEQALDDDLNISGALGQLFEVVRESNRALNDDKISPAHVAAFAGMVGIASTVRWPSNPMPTPTPSRPRCRRSWTNGPRRATDKNLEAQRRTPRRDRWVGMDRQRHQGRAETHPQVNMDHLRPEPTTLDLEHTAHRMLFENTTHAWEALGKIANYLQFSLKPGVQGELIGKPYIGPDVFVGEGTIIEHGAMIKGPAWIGANCHIRNGCYVRENVIVGDDAVLGNSCEFKNCVLFDGAQVPHFSYVGDSVLGYKSHLGAGAILSNVKLDHGEIVIERR